MKQTLGIRAQLVMGIVIMTLAGIGMVGIISIKIIEDRAVSWKISEAEKTVGFARSSFARLSSPDDPQRALASLASALKSNDVGVFRLSDASGRTMLGEGALPKEAGEALSYSDGIKINMIGGGWLSGVGSALIVEAPLDASRSGRGVLRFAVPLADIREDMAGVRKFLLVYAALDSAIIIAFGFYFLSRSIVAPLKKLEVAAQRISGGALGERADVAVDNEVGSLAASFNRMAERLEGEIKTLERVNTELLRAQEELLRASTLAAVGRLAAGIAHEIGNPLGAVRGYIDILSKAAPGGDEKDIAERCAREVDRIDTIVREFLELSRPSKRATAAVDIAGLLQEAVSASAVHRDFDGVELVLRPCGALPGVRIDEGKLRQVFMNLLLNAAQSMRGSAGPKTVTVEAALERHPVDRIMRPRRRKDDQPFLFAPDEAGQTADYVAVKITDQGAGIGEEDAKKIFDPFFTTKEVGTGTGLGLFVSQSIIRTYGGEISFVSIRGEGTAFTVLLPVEERGRPQAALGISDETAEEREE